MTTTGSRQAHDGRVLAGVKATPSGWPPASLDPDSGHDTPGSHAAADVAQRHHKPQNHVSTVSGDCQHLTIKALPKLGAKTNRKVAPRDLAEVCRRHLAVKAGSLKDPVTSAGHGALRDSGAACRESRTLQASQRPYDAG